MPEPFELKNQSVFEDIKRPDQCNSPIVRFKIRHTTVKRPSLWLTVGASSRRWWSSSKFWSAWFQSSSSKSAMLYIVIWLEHPVKKYGLKNVVLVGGYRLALCSAICWAFRFSPPFCPPRQTSSIKCGGGSPPHWVPLGAARVWWPNTAREDIPGCVRHIPK